jgi:light-regulated signal transduction histidine kinase (bacteriophytochrome)
VNRTKESVILHDATEEARFADDAYIARARPKSVLCLPLLRQSALVGVLYLENNLTAGAFTPERLSLLQVLSTQAAISLENAVLYADLSQENAERRRAEQEVRTLNSELERRVSDRTAQLAEANKELEAFSYSVSHDLKSPLRAIEGFSLGILEDYGDKIPVDARDSLLRVRKASLRMSQLIEDLLDLSRVTRAELNPRPVDLSSIAREITADLQKESPGRDVTIVIADGVRAIGDDKLLRIALENLLGNAFKFTSKHARARIEFGTAPTDDGRTTYFVRDDGAGFDMRYSGSKLFGTFQRMHKDSDFAGTGVGLSTVRRIINRHGGRIWAEGAVEQGATFYFTL